MCWACVMRDTWYVVHHFEEKQGESDSARKHQAQVRQEVLRSFSCSTLRYPARLPERVWQQLDICAHCYGRKEDHALGIKCLVSPTEYVLYVGLLAPVPSYRQRTALLFPRTHDFTECPQCA